MDNDNTPACRHRHLPAQPPPSRFGQSCRLHDYVGLQIKPRRNDKPGSNCKMVSAQSFLLSHSKWFPDSAPGAAIARFVHFGVFGRMPFGPAATQRPVGLFAFMESPDSVRLFMVRHIRNRLRQKVASMGRHVLVRNHRSARNARAEASMSVFCGAENNRNLSREGISRRCMKVLTPPHGMRASRCRQVSPYPLRGKVGHESWKATKSPRITPGGDRSL